MAPAAGAEKAPAKINLTLRVLGRRADGYHDIESLVAFAGVGDALTFTPGGDLALTVGGPTAAAAGDVADNLVLKAAHALAERVTGLRLGWFTLSKRLPVAAGLGGGSADAAAALRLLARANALAPDDPRLMQAARATGADVPVCLDPHTRLMRGIGDRSRMFWRCCASCQAAASRACRGRARRVSVCSTRAARRAQPPARCGSATRPGGCARRCSAVETSATASIRSLHYTNRPHRHPVKYLSCASSSGRCRTQPLLRALPSSARPETKRAHPWRSRRSAERA